MTSVQVKVAMHKESKQCGQAGGATQFAVLGAQRSMERRVPSGVARPAPVPRRYIDPDSPKGRLAPAHRGYAQKLPREGPGLTRHHLPDLLNLPACPITPLCVTISLFLYNPIRRFSFYII